MTDVVITTMGGGTQRYSANELQQATGCRIITPDAEDYDERRAIWNGMIDKRPAAILVAKDEAGITAAVRFASANGLLMSLRSGGHNIAGMALCDSGLVLDMQDMKSVTVNPEARTARVQPGASLGDVDRATQEFGLVVPTGINSTTGIAGLALGGGFGWVTRKYGLTVDCLKAVRLVTASGSIITASKTENSDIFWALQGGGGNFGVVTEFTFDLHPVGPEVFAGMLVHPIADFPDVTRALQALVADAPDELTCWAVSRKAPPLPFIPEEWHGREVMVVPFCFIGDLNAAEAATLGVRSIGNPIATHFGPMPFADWQTSFDPLLTEGARNYWKSHDVAAFSDAAIDIIHEAVNNLPSDECEIFFGHVGGTATRIPADATAWPNRQSHFVVNVHTRWQDPADDGKCVQWARKLFQALEPHAMGTRYVNFIPEGDEANNLEDAFGENLDRLVRIKEATDPDNLFRTNINLTRKIPAGVAG